MKTQFKLVSAFIIAVGIQSSAFAAPTAQDTADKNAILTACAQESKTAGCGDEVVGKGLLKCINGYKKANKQSFTISSGCKSTIQQFNSDKKAGK